MMSNPGKHLSNSIQNMKVRKLLGVMLSSHFLLTLEKQYKCYKVLFGKTRTSLNCSVLPLRGEP